MPDKKLLGQVLVFGVALRLYPMQQHAAIVFKDREKGFLSLLHLASHYDLRMERWKSPYKCIPCQNFDFEELQYFAEHASRIYSQNPGGIPYGFEYVGAGAFNGDSSFKDSPGAGLTCATFILAFFEDLGYEVLDLKSWDVSPEDTQWQNNIFDMLCKEMSSEKAAAQYHLIGQAVRYKPEEVLASVAIYDSAPVTYSEAAVLATQLMTEATTP